MRIEVEQKFVLDNAGVASRLQAAVQSLGGSWQSLGEQVDSYFAHPVRDFSVTDEALRIRRQGEHAWVTYKGAKLDTTTKARHEIDSPLSDLKTAADLAAIFEAVGFTRVADVKKSRQTAQIFWKDHAVEVALDEVPPLGHFVELEIVASDATLDAARDVIASLANELGLSRNERRSYLELLLEG